MAHEGREKKSESVKHGGIYMEGLQCQHPMGCQDRREGIGVSREVKVLWEDVEKNG